MTESFPYHHQRNFGEKESYFVPDTHQAIVDRVTFDAVKELLKKRKLRYSKVGDTDTPLKKTVWCGQCGSFYRRKKSRGTVYWVCFGHDSGKSDCEITQIPEAAIVSAFPRLYGKLKYSNEEMLRKMMFSLLSIRERGLLWSTDIMDLNNQVADLLSQNYTLATLKQQGLVDPDIFISQSNVLAEQLQSLKLQKERLMASDEDDTIEQTRSIIEVLENGPDFLEAFDEELFRELIDKIIVDSNEQLRFCLKNGLELREKIERTKR